MVIALAICLAVLGSLSNAWAAVLQHDAVDDELSDADARTVSAKRMLRLLTTPRWLLGLTMIGLGAAVHIAAIALAPITLVQPIGVLSILFAIVGTSRQSRTWPAGQVWLGAIATVIGLGVFTVCAAVGVADHPMGLPPSLIGRDLWWAVIVLGLVSACFAGLGRFGPGWLRCVGWACACATLFGVASALMRTLTLMIREQDRLLSWSMVPVLAIMAVCYLGGGWLAQQAYASGPAVVVLSCLTVVDPLVAVGFGLVVLGEGHYIVLSAGIAMAIFAAMAATGVLVLSRFHPEVQSRS